jgi:hypothetical protein
MTPVLLFVHGRSQASNDEIAKNPEQLASYVLGKKRSWLGGLAKGLITAGHRPADESAVLFPFYGNVFADAIRAYEDGGGQRPDLETLAGGPAEDDALVETKALALLDAAGALDFDPARELGYTDPKLGEVVARRADDEELGWGDVLRLPVLRSAMQFISRKTGAPTLVIERFLDDVAYYLQMPRMRETVLKVVMDDLNRKLPNGGELVVVGHSLGSVVAYDVLTALPGTYRVRQFITAGSPLGMPVVQRHLLGADGGPKAAVPAAVPRRSNGWLNAYDVLDFVALLHPLAGEFAETVPGQVTDERTHNATGPHSISDYLADPDVAGPIGRALEF